MTKAELLASFGEQQTLIAAAVEKIKTDIEALDEGTETPEVEELKKKIEDLELALASKTDEAAQAGAKVLELSQKLKEVDAAAKAIDASIPDEA